MFTNTLERIEKPITYNKKRWYRIKKDRFYYYLIIPGIIFFIIFRYLPMVGIVIAFKDINPFDVVQGILHSPWVGFKHFIRFLNSYYFLNILGNTIIISFYKLLFGFPAPIILAILFNEVRNRHFKRIIQSISYLPHFISMVVVVGFIYSLLSTETGFINNIIKSLGGDPIVFLGDVKYFRGVLVGSSMWKDVGWGSIIYIASITSIDEQLYEAAIVDGANKWNQVWHITLPGIRSIIVIMFVLSIGGLLDAGFEQILLLYSPQVYGVADIIDTYVYREGILSMNYSFSTAVGFFKSTISVILVLGSNYIAKRFGQTGVW